MSQQPRDSSENEANESENAFKAFVIKMKKCIYNEKKPFFFFNAIFHLVIQQQEYTSRLYKYIDSNIIFFQSQK